MASRVVVFGDVEETESHAEGKDEATHCGHWGKEWQLLSVNPAGEGGGGRGEGIVNTQLVCTMYNVIFEHDNIEVPQVAHSLCEYAMQFTNLRF